MERLRFGMAWIVLAPISIFGPSSLLVRCNHIDPSITNLLFLFEETSSRRSDHGPSLLSPFGLLVARETCFSLKQGSSTWYGREREQPRVSTHANRPSDVLTFGEYVVPNAALLR